MSGLHSSSVSPNNLVVSTTGTGIHSTDRNHNTLLSRNIKTVLLIITTTAVAILLSSVIVLLLALRRNTTNSSTISDGIRKFEADFIIIGGGTAGCVIASRLAEYGFETLLLSSGSDDRHNPLMKEQALFGQLLRTPHFKHNLPSNLVPNLSNRAMDIIVWNTLGGNSINGGGAQRLTEHDWNHFVKATNDPSFHMNAMSNYYNMVENYTSTRPSWNSNFHGNNGPMKITQAHDPVFNEVWKNVASELNETFTDDFVDNIDYGFSFEASSITNGIRCWSCDAYLTSTSNLKVLTSTTVMKLTIDERTKQVKNVLFLSNDGLSVGIARKEYILSAGVFFSPHLLMLSGIGDRKILQDNNISVVHELKQVGKNLMDNGMLIVKYQTQNFSIGQSLPIALINTQTRTTNYNSDTFFVCKMDNNTKQLTVRIFNAAPKSTAGCVSLHNSNPLTPPKIILNYLTDSEDLERFVNAITYIRKVMSTDAITRYANITEIVPGLRERDLSAYVRSTLSVGQHFCGTCAIGEHAETSVVDKHFKVHGISNLRVVDASVFPANFAIKTGPFLTVHALAEKAVDILRHTYS